MSHRGVKAELKGRSRGAEVLPCPPKGEVFADRRAAGRALALALQRLDLPEPVVLALPRGGVPVALEVARALSAPLDLLLVRKLGAPGQPELAVGAVAGSGTDIQTVLNDGAIAATGTEPGHVQREKARALAEMARRRRCYLQGRSPAAVVGRTVVVVDDGLATGTTARAALQALRALKPARVVLAVPVAPASTLRALAPLVDTLVCLWAPEPFQAVGAHYRDFRQVSDEEVLAALGPAAQAARLPQA